MKYRKEQLYRYKKYIAIHARHISARKLLNLLRVEWRLKTNNPDLRGLYPYILFVDITSACNLRCPLCTMGQRNMIPRKSQMDVEHYRRIVEPLKDHLFQVFLYNWSEPLLSRHVFDIISLNRLCNIGSVISSNLSLPIDGERLVASGLEYLIVSADGLSQEVYETYRVGGDICLVAENLSSIIRARKKAKSKHPFIEWQCLVTRKNESELEELKAFAYELGVDAVRFANLNLFSADGELEAIEKEWLPSNPSFRYFESTRLPDIKTQERLPCYWLWRTAIVNPNGGITPCCLYDTVDWGNAFEIPFLKVWNNGLYQASRRLSLRESSDPDVQTVCHECNAPFIYR